MPQGPLFQEYTPQFSGHETFPLRYGWLKKAYDRVAETAHKSDNRTVCWDNDAIAHFGVGKNMVASIRYWAKAAGIIKEQPNKPVEATMLGHTLFGQNGLDPYMEHPATLWLIHWKLASCSERTTWFWSFSHYPAVMFERDDLVKRLCQLARDRNWKRAAAVTINNDVGCFIRTYVARQPSKKDGTDDTLESPLTELGLIKAVGKKDGFRFARSPKPTLGNGIFAYALISFWNDYYSNAAALSFEAITHAPGSPGRVFAFDENDVADRLAVIDDVTNGTLRWSETAGLKQVVRSSVGIINDNYETPWLEHDYNQSNEQDAA